MFENLTWYDYTALGLIALFIGFLILEIYAVLTPPNATQKWITISISMIVGGIGSYLIYSYWPLGFSYLKASISGVYDWQGYLYVVGIVALVMAFLYNTIKSWNQDKPLKLIQ